MEVDLGTILFHILVVLVAAKLAAELSERVGIPAVVGEIFAGIVVGPSMLDLVGTDEVLHVLGELGVVLLLLQVGLEMDLGELGKVGRASLFVAVAGVVAPLALGIPAMEALGFDFNTSLFVAAALTATSVGITARVFGDLRALATTEARLVLGAAVADDVIGLVVLTVVVRIVTEGSLSLATLGEVVGGAALFLVVGGGVALLAAPPLLRFVERFSRSPGTLVAIAFAFALAFAELADLAKLAPIVGAFIAGVALSRSDQSERIHAELAPIGHLLIPVFFLQVGIAADVSAFFSVTVLRDAAVLLVVAVVGKLVSPIGAWGMAVDKPTIGLGMLPRGEVGLIFAAIGLQAGVLGDDLYAALLLVVLITTLGTPVLLRIRWQRLRQKLAAAASVMEFDAEPADGWLAVRNGQVVLTAVPPPHLAMVLAFETAVLVSQHRASDDLLEWFSHTAPTATRWSTRATAAFLNLLRVGNARSWRFLEAIDILGPALPEVGDALRARRSDALLLDAARLHEWPTVERLREHSESDAHAGEFAALEHPERLYLAGFLVDALGGWADRVYRVRQLVGRLELGARAEEEIATLVDDPGLLWSMASRADSLSEQGVLELAAHLQTPETARAAHLLAIAVDSDREHWERQRLDTLQGLVQDVLADTTLGSREARNLLNVRRGDALRLLGDNPAAAERIESAPRSYILTAAPASIARHAVLLAGARRRDLPIVEVHESVEKGSRPVWDVDVIERDRPGLLAVVTGLLADVGLDVVGATAATWPDGTALDSFTVSSDRRPDAAALRTAIVDRPGGEFVAAPVADATVVFDATASPWYTECEVRADDRIGLLHAIATAFAEAGVEVHGATIERHGTTAVDRFAVTRANGAKLDTDTRRAFVRALTRGARLELPPRGGFRRLVHRLKAVISSSGNGNTQATEAASRRNDAHLS